MNTQTAIAAIQEAIHSEERVLAEPEPIVAVADLGFGIEHPNTLHLVTLACRGAQDDWQQLVTLAEDTNGEALECLHENGADLLPGDIELAGLLLVAAQFESLVHAAEHPFHADDEICAPFASFEKHDHAIAVLSATNSHPHLT